MFFSKVDRSAIVTPIVIASLVVVFASGCGKSNPSTTEVIDPPKDNAAPEIGEPVHNEQPSLPDAQTLAWAKEYRPTVEAFCADCHAMPRPSSSPRDEWQQETEQGFMLYETSGRKDLVVPSKEDVLRYFECQAPEKHVFPESIFNRPPSPISFRPAAIRLPGTRPPGVTNVRWIDLGIKNSLAMVYCDVGTGQIKAHWPQEPDAPTERLATLLQPVHVEPCDLDQDGLTDLVVADIGEFNADDSDLGRVVWLRRKPDSEKFETIVLKDNLSRVADVQPGDFDGDGDLDLIVAVFGWRNSGRTVLLTNNGMDPAPSFELTEIDDRHGPVHVPVTDLNHDGNLDFIALISQDQEIIEAFLGDGSGGFTKQTVWRAPDPAYGSSGIQLIDMDGDDDLDLLYTNGDSFDRGAKPYHSVQWLENTGGYPFEHHPLTDMPGVLNAKAADFDADGDLDIVAVSRLAAPLKKATSSIVMLIQAAPGVFEATEVESNQHHHLTVETGDFDGNGKVDFAAGIHMVGTGSDQPDVTIWWND